MAELPREEFDEYIDWSKGDLLDACNDPAIGGMGLGSKQQTHNQSQCDQGAFCEPFANTPDLTRSSMWQGDGSEQATTQPPPFESDVEAYLNSSTVLETISDAQKQVEINSGEDLSRETAIIVSSSAFSNTNGQLSQASWAPSMTRPVSPCRECGEPSFKSETSPWWWEYEKDVHAKSFNHGAYGCQVNGCDRTFIGHAERDAHEKRPHISGHGRVSTCTPNDCVECEETFRTKADLLRHAKETQHQPYGCECGALFSRLDVLNRHLESFSTGDPKHPCKYCKLHRGPDGFRRLDHLMQHIRSYHHLEMEDESTMTESRLKYVFPVCSHLGCPQYRDETYKQLPRKAQAENKPFHSQSAYTKHMREEHNECSFPCDVPGCSRIGRRGYFREKDLLNHRRLEHPDAPKYGVTKRELRMRCTEPGCSALLDPSSIKYHLLDHTDWSKQKEEKLENLAEGSEATAPQEVVDLLNELEQQQQAPFDF